MHLLYRSLLSATLFLFLFANSAVHAQTNLITTSPASITPGNENAVYGLSAGGRIQSSANSNSIFGNSAGYVLTTGYENSFFGSSAGWSISTGYGNSFFGSSSGRSTATGYGNVFFGHQAGFYNMTGSQNVYVGANAGRYGQGEGNTLIGSFANALGTNAFYNTAVGLNALSSNNSRYNVAVGINSGLSNYSGTYNSFIGSHAGGGGSTGSNNVAVGDSAGFSNMASGNIYVGSRSGYRSKNGTQNTFVGNQAGYSTDASANTFIGYQAGRSNTAGQFNTFVGVQAGINNTTGNSNFIMGTNAGSSNTTGSANFFLGDNAGVSNTTGGFNVFLGTNAGTNNTNGNNNTAIGFEANVGSGSLSNATAIGFRAVASASNSLVLGNGANVGIGTSGPTNKLHVVADADNQSGLRLEKLTSNSPASATGQTKFLTVDGSGNVILGSTTSGGRVGADLWQQKGQYLQNVAGNGVVIGEEVSKTPAGYRLYVQDGILTEKVKVAVKNASEWRDYVFEKDYKLVPLSEVARFIQANKHLPGVPSATEVVEQGVDVARMDAKLLEKIEELTLYSIQQQKEIDELKKQNAKVVELEKLVKQLLERK